MTQQQGTTTAEQQQALSTLIDEIMYIINSQRLTKENCLKIKQNLKRINEDYKINISREFLAREYKGTPNNFNQRFKILKDKTELKTTQVLKYINTLKSEQGDLFMEKDREILNFFIV